MSDVVAHKSLPKTWHSKNGWKVVLLGGSCPGQWLRMGELPFPASVPMVDGSTFDLRHNHPSYKYEWYYVKRKAV